MPEASANERPPAPLAAIDALHEARYLIEALHMAASSLDREAMNAFQIVIRHAHEALDKVESLLDGDIAEEDA